MRHYLPILTIAFFLTCSTAQAAEYQIDKGHSTVGFKVRHLFSKVQGSFKEYTGSFAYDPAKPETWQVTAEIQAASIDTGVADRDKHLKSPDFFEVDKYPTLSFKSTGVSGVEGSKAKIEGLLTMHGVEKPVTLDVEFYGEAKDPWGNSRLGLTATTILNRQDFGLAFDKVTETGQLLVGNEIEITLDIEAIQQKPAEAAPAAV